MKKESAMILLCVVLCYGVFLVGNFVMSEQETNTNKEEEIWDRMFYDIYVKPFKDVDIYETCTEKTWKLDRDIKVTGVLITISTWHNLPVKVGVCLNGAGVDAGSDESGKVLACLTTPATGGGSSTIYVPVNAEVEKGETINVYVWGHNMNKNPLDFHAQVIIYYKLLKSNK